jgi:multidrug efflux pump subunit AcrA (membrane-fusion protein)
MTELTRVSPSSLRFHHYGSVPDLPVRLGSRFLILLVLLLVSLVFVPWRQSVEGVGRVVAYSPTDREQNLQAPVSGRVVKWFVVEGSRVKQGDPIVEMADIDPDYLQRIEEQIAADEDRIVAAEARLRVYKDQVESYEKAREMKVQAMRLKVDMADQKLKVARQKVGVARANLETARLNLTRIDELTNRGISSQRQREVVQLDYAKAEAELSLSEAGVLEATAHRMAAQAEVSGAEAGGSADVAKAQAEVGKAESEAAYARGDIARLKVQQSRQLAQKILSPVDGTVVSMDGVLGGGVVHAGQQLVKIVPDTSSRAAELYVDGNDAALLSQGRAVRLQFEGWPALQFVGWPGAAAGTYGGVVSFVDPAATDQDGRVRVLVVPDSSAAPWPHASVLRQQVRARAWFLLDEVTLGWEAWRRLNQFPPTLDGRPQAKPQSQKGQKGPLEISGGKGK